MTNTCMVCHKWFEYWEVINLKEVWDKDIYFHPKCMDKFEDNNVYEEEWERRGITRYGVWLNDRDKESLSEIDDEILMK